jgi:2-methylcitrate dehydratase PrpD
MQGNFLPRLAGFFAGLTLQDLDDVVVERTKVCIVDAIGCAFAGHQTEYAAIGFDIAGQFPASSGNATVWVKGFTANYIFAAINNSLLVHNMIHDDMNQSHRGHAGNLMVPTVLAIAEARQLPCATIIPAIVAGYEAMGRVAAPAVAFSVEKGFRGTSTYGPFGVAAAVSRMLELNAEQTAQALACSASFSLGLLEPFNTGTMEWRFQNSVVIMGGIMAALTAQRGAKAAATALEGESGFLSAFCGKKAKEEIVAAWMEQSKTLGKEYDITKTIFKPYSTCGYNLIGCNIALNLIEKHDIKSDQIKEIVVKVSPDNKAYPGVEFNGPFETPDLALLSKPFMLGAAVVTRDLQIDTYQNCLNDPEILKVAKLVRMEADEAMSQIDTEIQFITKDDQVFKGDLSFAKLEELFIGWDAAVEKFHSLAGVHIDEKKIDEIVDMVMHLEDVERISDLTRRIVID